MRSIYSLLFILTLCFPVMAQDGNAPEITADNIEQLQVVTSLDFSDGVFIPPLTPQAERQTHRNQFEIGWFVYADDVERFLLIDKHGDLNGVFVDGALTYAVEDVDVIDAVAFGGGFYAILFKTDDGFSVWYDNLSLYGGSNLRINVIGDAYPSTLWVTCPEPENLSTCHATVEASDMDYAYLYRLPPFAISPGNSESIDLNQDELDSRQLAPEGDPEAVVRIGRIPYPYVVTSSLEGLVKLWSLDTDEILYSVDNSTGEPAVFGNINRDATHLVWRDNSNETLYLLDFESEENRVIAPLNGAYAQWYFLSNDASVIIAVNLGGEPNVIAWDTETGERRDLGTYRQCGRPQPDMVRLAADGTTLIIACDTGLDIWQVREEG